MAIVGEHEPTLTEFSNTYARLSIANPKLTIGCLLKNYKKLTSGGVKLSEWKRITGEK